jgi:hypothetical protein
LLQGYLKATVMDRIENKTTKVPNKKQKNKAKQKPL